MGALTLFQRKSMALGIVDPADSLYAGPDYDPSHPVALVFDVIPSEEDDLENVGTINPIENGAFVSDNIRTMPEKATFTAVISQSTLANILSAPQGQVLQNSSDRVNDAYNYIHDEIFKKKAVFDFVSGLKVYQNYFMASFKVNRDPETAMALSCTFTIQELNIISTQTVNAPKVRSAPVPSAAGGAPSSAVPGQDQGQQATTSANPAQQAGTTEALRIFQAVGLANPNETSPIGGGNIL